MVTSRLEDARRLCAWCKEPIPDGKRRDARTCSKQCRQANNRFCVAAAAVDGSRVDVARRMRFGYADSPYLGCCRLYHHAHPVGPRPFDGRCWDDLETHRLLVEWMRAEFPDGWALSARARSMLAIGGLCTGLRVAAWVRGSRKGVSYGPRSAWEPLFVAGGRPRRLDVAADLDDVLLYGGRQRSHPGALIGMKPAAFGEWMFRQLGALPGDDLVDVFPGSGAIGRAWQLYASGATRATRRESCLAGAVRRLGAALAPVSISTSGAALTPETPEMIVEAREQLVLWGGS